MKRLRAIGLMSGTSLDGIDLACIMTDGTSYLEIEKSNNYTYDDSQRKVLQKALQVAPSWKKGSLMPEEIVLAQNVITSSHVEIVHEFLKKERMTADDIDIIGFHGQTILHDVCTLRTEQIGDGAELSRLTGIDVIADFRQADMEAGGQGAPFAPLFHAVLCEKEGFELPVAIVNIGGVSNVTWIGEDKKILGFDTGTGNALIDDLMLQSAGVPFDRGGSLAEKGQKNQAQIETWLTHNFFQKKPPKSLDRNMFKSCLEDVQNDNLQNAVATLTSFTSQAIMRSVQFMPQIPKLWIMCGGGRHNKTMMSEINTYITKLGGVMKDSEQVNWSGDVLEAQCFAYLAVRSFNGLPISLPSVTGCSQATEGGVLFHSN